MRHLQLAFRRLRASPVFTMTAVATVAVCLGANLAIFAVVDAILLRPLSFPDADRLVTIFNTYPQAGVERDGVSVTNYYERRGHIAAFSAISIFRESSEVIGEAGATEQERTLRISPDFFETLGVGLLMGRSFNETETISPIEHSAVIVTEPYWRQHLAADPHVLGRALRVNGAVRTIVGVSAPDFRFLSWDARIVMPLTSPLQQRTPAERHSGGGGTHMIARLKPGVTLAAAQSQIDAHNAAVEQDDPKAAMMAAAGFRSVVRPLHTDYVRAIRPTLWLIQAGSLFLLLMGVVNLVNLLLIRASVQRREMAIRRSLGAGSRHLVYQVLVETVLLTVVGGVAGLAVGASGIRLLDALGASRLPLGAHLAFDGRLAAIGIATAVLLGTLISIPIALSTLRRRLDDGLRSDYRSGTVAGPAQRLRHGFIVAQVAIAFVLLAGATLLAVSLRNVRSESAGFRPDRVITGRFVLPYAPFPGGSPQRSALLERLVDSIGQQPDVAAAGTITNLPLTGNKGKSAITPQGYVPPIGESLHGHYAYSVAGNYFSAIGIPLREGRFLTSNDAHRQDRVCVVDDDFARRYWPNGGAVGQRVFQGTDAGELFTIVGIVGSVKQADLTEPQGQGAVYFPFRYRDDASVYVVTRTRQRPEAFAATLRQLVRAADPELAVDDIRSMDTRVADSLIGRRSPAVLAGIVAGIALLLAAIGTYGVLSYTVAQRRREIGVRMALGAQTAQIRLQFLWSAARLLGPGMLLGVAGVWIAGRAMRSLLFGVAAFDPGTLLVTMLVLGGVSLIAVLIPAQRAARVDPLIALSSE